MLLVVNQISIFSIKKQGLNLDHFCFLSEPQPEVLIWDQQLRSS